MKKYNKKGFIDAQLFAPMSDTMIGYTWVGNDSLSLSTTFEYEIGFECDGIAYNRISYNADTEFLLYDTWTVYNEGWLSTATAAKTIKITGEIDARLLHWLKANGTFKKETITEITAKKFTYDTNSVIVDYAINDSNGNKISDMKTQIDTNTSNITTLTSDNDTNKTNIATNTSDITSLKSSKQDTLTSGTNIKTINGESVLGSGDLTISGGSGGTKLYRHTIKSSENNKMTLYCISTLSVPFSENEYPNFSQLADNIISANYFVYDEDEDTPTFNCLLTTSSGYGIIDIFYFENNTLKNISYSRSSLSDIVTEL